MCRAVLAIISILCLGAPNAFAGLDLTWSACNTSPAHTSDLVFACNSPPFSEGVRLFGCFQVPVAMPRFYTLEVVLDVEVEAASLPPFWHLESGGCNMAGFGLFCHRPRNLCPGVLDPWLSGSPECPSCLATAYEVGVHGPNRGRLHMEVSCGKIPTLLEAKQNYFGFVLLFVFDNAVEAGGPCEGCPSRAAIVWNSGLFRGLDGQEVTVTSPGLVSQCVTVNGASPATCAATPTLRPTWGSIKSLYR